MPTVRWLLPLAVRAPASFVAALLFVRFADEWFTFFPFGAVVPIRAELDLSYAEAGIVFASLTVGGILGHGFTVAADFVSRRLLASLGAAAYGLCMIAFGLADSWQVLALAGFAWGASSDAFVHGCEIALVDLARENLAPALARVNVLGAVGDLLGPLTLAGALAAGLSWRVPLLGGGALMLLYAAVLAGQRFPRPQPREDARTPVAAVLAVVRDRRIVVLALIAGLFSLLDEPFWGFTIALLERDRDLATAIVTAGVAGGIVGYLLVDAVTRRLATRPALLITGVAVLLTVAGIIVATPVILIGAAAVAFGLGGALFYSVLQATYLGLRPGQAGSTEAVVSTIGLAGAAFPPLVGAVSDAAGLGSGLALYALAAALMLALVLIAPGATRGEAETTPTPHAAAG